MTAACGRPDGSSTTSPPAEVSSTTWSRRPTPRRSGPRDPDTLVIVDSRPEQTSVPVTEGNGRVRSADAATPRQQLVEIVVEVDQLRCEQPGETGTGHSEQVTAVDAEGRAAFPRRRVEHLARGQGRVSEDEDVVGQ